ncbi:HEAT repeat domain-containing protein [Oerskovia turbata]
MPRTALVVHMTPAGNAERIGRSGIAARSPGVRAMGAAASTSSLSWPSTSTRTSGRARSCGRRGAAGSWRPRSGTAPCTCAGCRERGGFGAQRLRERRPDPLDGPFPPVSVLLGRLRAADSSDVDAIVEALHGFDGRRRGPVDQVAHLAEHPDSRVRTALVWVVARWSTPGALGLVERLAGDPDPEVRDAATAWLPDED